jgi:hypothetical protein
VTAVIADEDLLGQGQGPRPRRASGLGSLRFAASGQGCCRALTAPAKFMFIFDLLGSVGSTAPRRLSNAS